MSNRKQYWCSFCGKENEEVETLVAGPGNVFICDECTALCAEIVDEARAAHIEYASWSKNG